MIDSLILRDEIDINSTLDMILAIGPRITAMNYWHKVITTYEIWNSLFIFNASNYNSNKLLPPFLGFTKGKSLKAINHLLTKEIYFLSDLIYVWHQTKKLTSCHL